MFDRVRIRIIPDGVKVFVGAFINGILYHSETMTRARYEQNKGGIDQRIQTEAIREYDRLEKKDQRYRETKRERDFF